jgi:hypothetical protein
MPGNGNNNRGNRRHQISVKYQCDIGINGGYSIIFAGGPRKEDTK